MPVKELTRKVKTDKEFPGGVSSLPDKEEIIEKINEMILLLNEIEAKVEKQQG